MPVASPAQGTPSLLAGRRKALGQGALLVGASFACGLLAKRLTGFDQIVRQMLFRSLALGGAGFAALGFWRAAVALRGKFDVPGRWAALLMGLGFLSLLMWLSLAVIGTTPASAVTR